MNKFANIITVLGIAVFFYPIKAVSKVEFPKPLFREQPESGFFIGEDMKLCECGCGQKIIIKPYHSWYGTPRFISGHSSRGKNNPNFKVETCTVEGCNRKHYGKGLCQNHWHKKYRGKYQKQYYQDNKKLYAKQQKQYCRKNKKKIIKKRKKHYQDNKEYLLRQHKQWNQDNKEYIAEWHKQYRQTPAGKANIKRHTHNHRALTKDLTRETIQRVYEDNIAKYSILTCYLCFKPIIASDSRLKDSLDHSTPLSRGGNNDYDNLGVAHLVCNLRKNTKTLEEWFRICK